LSLTWNPPDVSTSHGKKIPVPERSVCVDSAVL
jgi:hypothetical protein